MYDAWYVKQFNILYEYQTFIRTNLRTKDRSTRKVALYYFIRDLLALLNNFSSNLWIFSTLFHFLGTSLNMRIWKINKNKNIYLIFLLRIRSNSFGRCWDNVLQRIGTLVLRFQWSFRAHVKWYCSNFPELFLSGLDLLLFVFSRLDLE